MHCRLWASVAASCVWHAAVAPTSLNAQGAYPAVADTLELTLENVGVMAVARDPALRAIRREITVASGDLRQARVEGLNPTLDATVFQVGRVGAEPREYSVALSGRIPWAGQRELRIDVATANLGRVDALVSEAVRDATLRARLALLAAVAAERRLGLAREIADASARLQEASQVRLEAGEISELEANLTAIEHGRIRARVIAAERSALETQAALRIAVAAPPSQPLRLVTPALAASALAMLPADSLLMLALARRPDVAAARRAVEQAQSQRRLAGREALPELELRGVAARDAGDESARLGVGVALPLPLIDRNQGRRAAADARLDQASDQLARLELVVRNEVAASHQAWRSAIAEADSLQALVLAPARENRPLLETAWREGKLSLPSLLLLRNQLLDAELDYWQAWEARGASLVRLEAAVAIPSAIREEENP